MVDSKYPICGAIAVIMVAASAKADDHRLSPSSWSGLYVGAQFGHSSAKAQSAGQRDFVGGPDVRHPSGGVFGPYAGYNAVLGNSAIVLGVEADLALGRRSDRFDFVSPPRVVPTEYHERSRILWSAATRVRAGYAFGPLLVYGAGGLAFAQRAVDIHYKTLPGLLGLPSSGPDYAYERRLAIGWTIGGGVDAALTDRLTSRAEYRHSDYGADRFSGVGDHSRRVGLADDRVTVGLAYRLQ